MSQVGNMKRVSLIGIAAIALATSSCDFHETQFATINGPNSVPPIDINNGTVAQLILSPSSIQLLTGQTAQITTNAPFALQTQILWTSSNSAVASVSTTGVVVAFTPGTVVITGQYTFDTTNAGATSVTVTLPNPPVTPVPGIPVIP